MSSAPDRQSDLRVAAIVLILPLYVAVVLTANYFGALHAPEPHDVKVAIVGPPSRTGPLAHELTIRTRTPWSSQNWEASPGPGGW